MIFYTPISMLFPYILYLYIYTIPLYINMLSYIQCPYVYASLLYNISIPITDPLPVNYSRINVDLGIKSVYYYLSH